MQSHLEHDAGRKTEPSARNSDGTERSKVLVLVVDDNEAMRYALARGLRAAGFETVEAAAGAEALALAKRAAAMVLDVHLPDIDGFEVCRLIRANPATAALPVVHLSTVFLDETHQKVSQEAGANAYLVPPISPPQLAAVVDGLVSRAT